MDGLTWFLTLCAVRGFGRTMGDMKKPSSRGRAWLRGIAWKLGLTEPHWASLGAKLHRHLHLHRLLLRGVLWG